MEELRMGEFFYALSGLAGAKIGLSVVAGSASLRVAGEVAEWLKATVC